VRGERPRAWDQGRFIGLSHDWVSRLRARVWTLDPHLSALGSEAASPGRLFGDGGHDCTGPMRLD
jgi:hypothetical protein